ncbi:uncharacterized protein (TIGR04255 family) [Sinorhizobium fredii]|uniref:TIGR04255 family protein n=1 Tax=Rhizobium fredii TaxID=380 RepID=UPI003516D30F
MFEPLNKSHAISETVFYFEFPNIQTTTLNAMLAAYPKVKDYFPRNDQMPGMVFEQSGSGFSINQVPGAEWKHFKPDGNPDWIARITPNSVSVHCLEYTRWTEVWPKAFEILSHIFSGTAKHVIPLMNVGLRYVDQFNFSGDVKKYSALDLIRKDSPHVAAKILQDGTKWHNYTGWFERSEPLGREVLQQLNIDAIEQADTNLPIVSITHASLLRASSAGELENFRRLDDINTSDVAKFMEIAHANNHQVLREILTDNILQRINLGVEA